MSLARWHDNRSLQLSLVVKVVIQNGYSTDPEKISLLYSTTYRSEAGGYAQLSRHSYLPTQIMCFMYNNILSTIVSRIGPVWTIALGPFSNNKDASLYLKIMDTFLLRATKPRGQQVLTVSVEFRPPLLSSWKRLLSLLVLQFRIGGQVEVEARLALRHRVMLICLQGIGQLQALLKRFLRPE